MSKSLLEENFTDNVFGRWERLEGSWRIEPDVEISEKVSRDIYFAPQEPSFVSWAIVWKEKDGTVKLMFTEAVGDQGMEPTLNFNSPAIKTYLKMLVTRDNGEIWEDTGYCEPLD